MSELDKRVDPELHVTQYDIMPTAATSRGRKIPETNEALNNGSGSYNMRFYLYIL